MTTSCTNILQNLFQLFSFYSNSTATAFWMKWFCLDMLDPLFLFFSDEFSVVQSKQHFFKEYSTGFFIYFFWGAYLSALSFSFSIQINNTGFAHT